MVEANDIIAEVLTEYPVLKEALVKRNKRFENLNNPVVFKTVGKFAKISDVAKVSGEDLDDLLKFINETIKAE